MSSMYEEALNGYNAYVKEQQKIEDAKMTLVIFDNIYEVVYESVPIKDVPVLTKEIYSPRGMTALYDSIGKTVLNGMNKTKADEKNILVVLTDGAENSSQEFTLLTLNQLTKKAQDELDWTVIFLGANMDEKHVAKSFGLMSKNVSTFDNSKLGATTAMKSASFATSANRSAARGFVSNEVEDQGIGMSAAEYLNNANVDLATVYKNAKDKH